MKVKDFLRVKYNLDINNFSNPQTNDLRNRLIYDGLNCSDVFEKELSDLSHDEIFSLFARRYIQPNGRAWFYTEIVEKGIIEMQEFLNLN
jgi:hypothetical protein